MFRGDRLKNLRISRGYTHEELADMLGIAFSQVYRYESGKTDPSTAALDKMASVFYVSVDYLLGRTDNPLPEIDPAGLSEREQRVIAALRQGNLREVLLEIVAEP